MFEALRSTVQTWECDRMGHLNVRYYFLKADEALTHFSAQLGLPPRELQRRGQGWIARDQHVRFLRELRPGAAFSVRVGVLEVGSRSMRVFAEIQHEEQGAPAATVTTDVVLGHLGTRAACDLPNALRSRAQQLTVALPAYGDYRGLERHAPCEAPQLEHVKRLGMRPAYLGPVRAELCDAGGYLSPAGHMACVADGVPYFMLKNRPPLPEGIGGAALEYRFVFRAPVREGDIVEVRTAPRQVRERAFQLCHHLFDAVTGRCVATSEAMVVAFDLEARKAARLQPDDRAALEAIMLPGLSA